MKWTRENIEAVLEKCDDKATGKRLIRKLGPKTIEIPADEREPDSKATVKKLPPPSQYKVGTLIYDECLEVTEGKAWVNGNEARKKERVAALAQTAHEMGLISKPTFATLRDFMCGEAA